MHKIPRVFALRTHSTKLQTNPTSEDDNLITHRSTDRESPVLSIYEIRSMYNDFLQGGGRGEGGVAEAG